MSATCDDWRYLVHLVRVGLAGNVTAVATQLGGASSGDLWDVETSVSLQEFLQRPNFEFPDGVQVVRYDLTDDVVFWRHFRKGPHLGGMLPLGTVSAPSGSTFRYAGESPAQLRGWSVAADIYGRLAAEAGLVVQVVKGRLPTGNDAASGRP